jgi:tRNA(fMet)-specific endonuclease VapC
MKVYIFDTNIASALWDKKNTYYEAANDFINSLNPTDRIVISCTALAEIKYGHKVFSSSDEKRRKKIEEAINSYKVIGIDKHTADPYSEIRSNLFKKYGTKDIRGKIREKQPENLIDRTTSSQLGIQENDIWIAAIAVQYNMILVSSDRMKRIKDITPNLLVIDWRSTS